MRVRNSVYDLWTDEEVEKLKAGYAAGLSFSQIALTIRGKGRSACIGKIDRLVQKDLIERRRPDTNNLQISITSQATQARRRATQALQKPPNNHNAEYRPPKVSVEVDAAPSETARPWLARLNHECRYPLGEPGSDMMMCCAPAGHGYDGDYCARHAARLFVKPERKRVKA